VVGHGRDPLKALLAPLFVAFDVILGFMGDGGGRCLLVTTWGCLLASLSRAKHDHLIAGGVLSSDATWLLERVPEEVAMSALVWAPRMALGQHAHAILVSLAVSLGLDMPALSS
jgi:hypothetical protein